MENKTLTLLPKNQLPEKALKEIEIAKQFNKLKEGDLFYYSKEFGLIKIWMPNTTISSLKLNKFNIPNKIKEISLSVINPDNIGEFDLSLEGYYILPYMRNLAKYFEEVPNKDLSSCYISTDALPGYKIIPNNINSVDMEGDLIYTKEYGVLFVQVLDIYESNYIKEGEKYVLS